MSFPQHRERGLGTTQPQAGMHSKCVGLLYIPTENLHTSADRGRTPLKRQATKNYPIPKRPRRWINSILKCHKNFVTAIFKI